MKINLKLLQTDLLSITAKLIIADVLDSSTPYLKTNTTIAYEICKSPITIQKIIQKLIKKQVLIADYEYQVKDNIHRKLSVNIDVYNSILDGTYLELYGTSQYHKYYDKLIELSKSKLLELINDWNVKIDGRISIVNIVMKSRRLLKPISKRTVEKYYHHFSDKIQEIKTNQKLK